MKDIPYLSLKDVTNMHIEEIKSAVNRVIESGWYLLGKENQKFENEYAEFIGSKYCVGVGNGLDALTLIIRAYIELGMFRKGDEIIVPSNTYIASILAISENGLTPVFVEPNIQTYNIDENLIEEKITTKTKAIMLVHLYGRCAYSKKIGNICEKYSLLLIEDNAQAHGCRCLNKRTGALGHAAGHSFYPGKNLGALGDGGAITTDDLKLANTVRELSNYGSSQKYVFDTKGRNSRLDEIQAAVLSVKLKYLDRDNDRRKQVAKMYFDGVDSSKYVLPLNDSIDNVFHVFPIRVNNRDEIKSMLENSGIHTMIHYPIPPHKQKAYKEKLGETYLISEKIHQEIISLPISPYICDDDILYIIDTLNNLK